MAKYPIFIICRDRLSTLVELIAWLERVGQNEIYLLDNDSSYPPLLQFYGETKHRVIRLGRNFGNIGLWQTNLLETLGIRGKYVVTDPDVVPTATCPKDAIDILSDLLDRFPDRIKAGLGLRIDDLPDHYPRKSHVLEWERQYWTNELAPGLFDANIDTTFAMYRPGVPWSYGPSVRTGPPYLLRHVPWYTDPDRMTAEEAYYLEHADPAIATWSIASTSTRVADVLTSTNEQQSGDGAMVALTIGMATYNDFDGVYFTLQSLRFYHDLTDTELLVVDNYGCEHTRNFVEGWAKGRYILATEAVGTAAPRDRVFREAHGEAVLCCDSHVLFAPGSIARLKDYYRDHPTTPDLLQGPLVYDDLQTISTHFDPVWREQMWGIWATDTRGADPDGEPFEIWAQGLGVFSCRKATWPGFHPAFRGFGGEEGYIHEKFRQHGGRTLCLPWLRWNHRFGRPAGIPYALSVEDKLRNYLIGHAELGLDQTPVLEHFAAYLPQERLTEVAAKARKLEMRKGKAKKRKGQKSANNGSPLTPIYDASPILDDNDSSPLVSCVLPTYNRPPDHQYLLEEAIESFLRQTYPNKELIVINDCPGQELVCESPGVRVVNVPSRFQTLGEKRNFGVQLASGRLIAPWDDDDISLPWRLSLSVERLGDAGYFNPKISWHMSKGMLHIDCARGVGHNFSLMTRSAFETVGGYPAVSLGEDAEIDIALFSKVRCHGGNEVLERSEWYYIYRWGVSPVHLSGSSNKHFWDEIGAREVQEGQFILRPHWRRDYAAETQQVTAAIAEAQSMSQDGGDLEVVKIDNLDDGAVVGVPGNARTRQSNGVVLFVVGGASFKSSLNVRKFPSFKRRNGESDVAHLVRVSRMVDEAIRTGGTHLLVPREKADWLGDNALIVEYFAEHYELVEARPEEGIVFALNSH